MNNADPPKMVVKPHVWLGELFGETSNISGISTKDNLIIDFLLNALNNFDATVIYRYFSLDYQILALC